MGNEKPKIHNHIYSRFHIKKWLDNGGKIYDKTTKREREINIDRDFAKRFYYSEDEPSNELEDRISNFEAYIGRIIKKVDTAKRSVILTGKEYELLKLYCVLCANRHHFAIEVIKDDESELYQSNDYQVGVFTINTKEDALRMTRSIIEEFERLKNQPEIKATVYSPIGDDYPCSITRGLHLEILHRDNPDIIISNRYCLTENTLDSDYLYTYVPVSPHTALVIVKSQYYLDSQTFENTKIRFGKIYGDGSADPYISEVFNGLEDLLFSSAYLAPSNVHVKETYIKQEITPQVFLKIKDMPSIIVKQMNSMFCEDGTLILYCDKTALESALKTKMPYREVMLF